MPIAREACTHARASQAGILFDRFHVLRHLNEALDEVRKSEYVRLTGASRRFIKGQKYALLFHRENLSLDGRHALKQLPQANRRPHTACLLKESFGQLRQYSRGSRARRFFENLRASLKRQRLKSRKNPDYWRPGVLRRHKMVLLIVVVTVIVFVIVDFALRVFLQKRHELKLRKERKEALDIGLKLDVSHEAKTLKRVEVREPKARILAVDDEPIILDSFRKILVVAGYSIDTVGKGQEALGLVLKHDYDFVFTDLKMPEMDGLEVTKAVKHLRPDIDVIVITGYASIETAVETMKYGAMDYVQKPFTEDELIDFFNKCLIRRKDRIERQMKPTVRLITPSTKESGSQREFNVPAGIFISQNHTWVNIEMNGTARVGIDDFVRKLITRIDGVELPKPNKKIERGETLFSIRHNSHTIDVSSPISGTITLTNTEHAEHPEWIASKPFELSWMCCIDPSNLAEELRSLKIGVDSINWYKEEIDKYSEIVRALERESRQIASAGRADDRAAKQQTDEQFLQAFTRTFLATPTS